MIVGSSTGRDGIHGATFASEELSEKSEAKRPSVQVGDPFTEKLLLEASLEIIHAQELQQGERHEKNVENVGRTAAE